MYVKICLVMICSFVTACGLTKTADDMVKTSNDIKGDSDHLAKRTDDLESELSKKESYAMFLENSDKLFGNGLSLFDYNSWIINYEPQLLRDAGAAMESLPFQLWKSDYNEDMNDLDLRFKFGAEVFLITADGFIPRSFDVNPLIPTRSFEAIGSLGFQLDRLSDGYVRVFEQINQKPISLYDLIISALQNRYVKDRHEQFPQAARMIRKYRREAIFILQMRHNYLPMVVLGRISKLQDWHNYERLWKMWVGNSRLLKQYYGESVNLNKLDPTDDEIDEWTGFLRSALETRQTMREIGITPEFNTNYLSMLSAIDIGAQDILKPSGVRNTHQQKLFDFTTTYEAVIEDGVKAKAARSVPADVPEGTETDEPFSWLQ